MKAVLFHNAKNILRTALIAVALLCFSAVKNNAQVFKASADKTTVGVGATFQVYFEFDAPDMNAVSNFRAPTFKGFTILGGPNQSTSMQIINGQMSSSITYSYVLSPQKIGTFTIPPASVSYKGKRYSTKPLTIKIVKGSPKAPPKQPVANKNGINEQEIAKNVFIRAVPNKTTVYQGEQLTVVYKLYTRLNISSPSLTKLPSYHGFWAEDLDMPQTINFHIGMYNGERFRVADIKKAALFATKSGRLKVTPFELQIPVLIRRKRRSQGLFDDFFNDPFFSRTQTYNYNAKSNGLTINVLPLPDKNVPPSFKGAVGHFNLSSKLDKNSVKVNEPISLKIKISGEGNISLIDIPDIKLPPGFEKYEPKTTTKVNKKDIVSGYKSIEYLIVPRIPGKKVIQPIEFSYFDPLKKKYFTLRTPKYEINIIGGTTLAENMPAGFSKEDIKLLSRGIRFIKVSDFKFVKKSDVRGIPGWFYSSLIVPTLLLLLVIGVKKRQDKISGNIELSRSLKAEKLSRKRLKAAKKALDSKQNELFYEEIAKALYGYLGDKLHINTSDFTLEKVEKILTDAGIEQELIKKINEISDKCEFARFSPNKEEKAEEKLYNETLELISTLERKIKKVKK